MEWKLGKVRLQVLQTEYRDSGMKMISVKNYAKACIAVWITKILNKDDSD